MRVNNISLVNNYNSVKYNKNHKTNTTNTMSFEGKNPKDKEAEGKFISTALALSLLAGCKPSPIPSDFTKQQGAAPSTSSSIKEVEPNSSENIIEDIIEYSTQPTSTPQTQTNEKQEPNLTQIKHTILADRECDGSNIDFGIGMIGMEWSKISSALKNSNEPKHQELYEHFATNRPMMMKYLSDGFSNDKIKTLDDAKSEVGALLDEITDKDNSIEKYDFGKDIHIAEYRSLKGLLYVLEENENPEVRQFALEFHQELQNTQDRVKENAMDEFSEISIQDGFIDNYNDKTTKTLSADTSISALNFSSWELYTAMFDEALDGSSDMSLNTLNYIDFLYTESIDCLNEYEKKMNFPKELTGLNPLHEEDIDVLREKFKV